MVVMADIKVLDDKTINQIAAGEVVERPVSVVKELIENAIDAGAVNISVEIKDGGISLIRITDNGCGIEEGSIKTAFLRHATSKIRSVTDLLSVRSLGFRGEALSSIAAVSQIELLTKTKESLFGIRYCLNGGKEMSYDEVGIPNGTTIIVRNLFFNTPARKKFLKSPTTEGNYISELMERMILSHPEISFRYIVNGKEKLSNFGNNDVKHNIYNVFGRDLASLIIPIEYCGEGFSITGFVGKPEVSRGNRNFEIFFVNSRYVKSNILSKAVEEAYKPYLMMHKYPFVCLYLEIDPEDIDVNVHPAKTEIRFLKETELYGILVNKISECLQEKELIVEIKGDDNIVPAINVKLPERAFTKTDLTPNVIDIKKQESDFVLENRIETSIEEDNEDIIVSTPEPFEKDRIDKLSAIISAEKKEEKDIKEVYVQETLFDKEFLVENSASLHKIIGQVFDTYWIVEFNDQMYIIDQHAAHEKVIYERFKKRIDEDDVYSQSISPAIIVTLNLAEIEILNKYIDNFNRLGFEIEPFGGREYAITAVPSDLYGLKEKEYFLAVLDDFVENPKVSDTKAVDDRIATMACKAAIKGNMKFTLSEAKALIDELLKLDNPYNCPHGRPTIISYKKQEIEKLFKRIV